MTIDLTKSIKAEVLEVIPSTHEPDHPEYIIDAYVNFKIKKRNIWCMVVEWSKYFPYNNPNGGYGVGAELIKNLIGKKFDIKIRYLDVATKRWHKPEKKISPLLNQKKPCDYCIYGEVLSKSPSLRWPNQIEDLIVDCGLTLNISFNKNKDSEKFKEGDYISVEGRMDAYLLNLKEIQ